MDEQQTIADVYSRMKAREEAQHILDSNKPGKTSKSIGEGAAFGSLSALLTGVLFHGKPETEKFLKTRTYELPFEAREAQKGTSGADLDAAKKSIKSVVQARLSIEAKHGKLSELTPEKVSRMSDGEQKLLKTVLASWANLRENNLPDYMPVPKGETLKAFAHSMKVPALMALVPAAVGALGGYSMHQKNLKRRDQLLREAGLKKSASESDMEISVEAQQSFWAEVEAIQTMQKLAGLSLPAHIAKLPPSISELKDLLHKKRSLAARVQEAATASKPKLPPMLQKSAAEDDPSWWETQKGQYRAMRAGDKGADLILAHPELIGQRTTKSLKGGATGGMVGVPVGVLLGLLASQKGNKIPSAIIGSLLGGAGGAITGQHAGMMEADRKWLADRGITQTYGGLSAEFSPEAKEKYLKKTASAEDIGVRIMNAAFRDEMQKIAMTKEAGWLTNAVSSAKGALGFGAKKGISAAEHSAISAAGEAAQNARFGKAKEVIKGVGGPAGPSSNEIRQRILQARGGNVSGREAANLGYLNGPAAARQQAAVASGQPRDSVGVT